MKSTRKGPYDGCNCSRSYAVKIRLAHKSTKHSDWVGCYHYLRLADYSALIRLKVHFAQYQLLCWRFGAYTAWHWYIRYIICKQSIYIYIFTVQVDIRVNSLANIFIALIFIFISIYTYPKGTTGKKTTLPLILFGWSLLWFSSWSIHPVERDAWRGTFRQKFPDANMSCNEGSI